MTPYKQKLKHRPDEGQIGDCWRTCIACLLNLLPEDVPHFCVDSWNDNARSTANARSYLATKGLSFIEYAFTGDLQAILNSVGAINPGLHYLLGGNSKNGCGHQVVCCDDGIVWDPSIDDSGIVGPMDDGFYWITWLVPLFIKRGGS